MSAGKPTPLVVGGWTVFAHPLFLAQVEALTHQVEVLKPKVESIVGCALKSAYITSQVRRFGGGHESLR